MNPLIQAWSYFFGFGESSFVAPIINAALVVSGLWCVIRLRNASDDASLELAELQRFLKTVTPESTADGFREYAEGRPSDRLLVRHIKACAVMHARGADVDAEALRGLSESVVDESLRWPRWVANSAVLFGLLGTLVGLSVAVDGAVSLITKTEGVSIEEVIRAISTVFDGLSTAFSTTLMGIFWAVTLSLLLQRTRRLQDSSLIELDVLCASVVYPRFRSSPSLALADSARSLADIQQKLSVVLNQLISNLNQQSTSILESLAVSSQKISDALASSTSRISASLSEATARTNESLANSASDLAERSAKVQEWTLRLIGTVPEGRQSLSEVVDTLQSAVVAAQSASTRIDGIAPQLTEAIARQIDLQTRDLREAVENLRTAAQTALAEQTTSIGKAVTSSLASEAQARQTWFENLSVHHSSLLGDVAEAAKSIKGSLAAHDPATLALAKSAGDLSAAAAALLAAQAASQNASGVAASNAGEWSRQLSVVGNQLNRITDRLDAADSRIASIGTRPGVLFRLFRRGDQ